MAIFLLITGKPSWKHSMILYFSLSLGRFSPPPPSGLHCDHFHRRLLPLQPDAAVNFLRILPACSSMNWSLCS